jgi:hypothetical protein
VNLRDALVDFPLLLPVVLALWAALSGLWILVAL